MWRSILIYLFRLSKNSSTVEQPVYINRNAYYNGAEPFERETERVVADHFNPEIKIIEEEKRRKLKD
ncbi:hypothetical protein [Neobacillus niacini]|uniref:hypothetical protein n=1 Tax=Neobacillus niacini TaxID=86668 RepID=UPI002041CD99|nr:hypothetical protein [Neobacillus niacini]MCM3694012.1 hypothetical protein [Neobacillus niacini]